ncbi:N-methyl-L-tryptophan oxidase [Acidicapsa dinghuensis]|uniref:N-methyl-L-tryptophan oxidase n=1 Tax=Acidicapsa dinghuensis TaxID=2218256 RepID=A0ABW1EE91_9BACT|nr:N-methyl-L-tryptophan oxidase [Acidicapsa dinghuensis]
MRKPKVAVLGLGIAGSSIAATLATRGYSVVAFEQFVPLHERGSSHGDTRIFRRVPHEGAVYVELAERSYEGWKRWNSTAQAQLFWECGGIDAGPDGSPMVQAAESLCRQYEQPFELLDGREFNRRYSYFRLPDAWRVVYQPASGVVCPDATRAFLHEMARNAGARLVHDARILDIVASSHGVRVRTIYEQVDCDVLIVAAGSWLPRIFPELRIPLFPERRVIAWYPFQCPAGSAFQRSPAFVFDSGGGWYGMPTPDGQIKIGHDKHFNEPIDPEVPVRDPDQRDAELLSDCIKQYFNGVDNVPAAIKSCIYTNTTDRHFLIDRHPDHKNILFFSCCSGHGFKYAPVYGEIAESMLTGNTWSGMDLFQLDRRSTAITRFSD